jgi:7-carboxy-7-deazaguanine synthase
MLTVEAIVDRIQELLPNGKFGRDAHLILTGGEPLLGWQRSYVDLLEEIKRRGMNLTNLTFETNGTQELKPDLARYLDSSNVNQNEPIQVTWSISSKLPSSGEKWEEAIKPEIIHDYFSNVLYSDGYFKWVVSNEDDYQDVIRAVEAYKDVIEEFNIPVYLMPAGGTTKVYDTNEKWVADLAMKHGWRYTPRLQVQLWKNAWGT